jgi:hypothetical protein
MENNVVISDCKSGCDFGVGEDANCAQGGNSCSVATLLVAEQSRFHDENLIQATRQINEILEGLPKDSEGRTLSFLHTRMGSLLAWVRHGATSLPPGVVTADDDDATLAKALHLKGYAAAGAGQA